MYIHALSVSQVQLLQLVQKRGIPVSSSTFTTRGRIWEIMGVQSTYSITWRTFVKFFFFHAYVSSVWMCSQAWTCVCAHVFVGGPRLMSSILLNSSSPLYTEAESLTWICSWCTGLVWTVTLLWRFCVCLLSAGWQVSSRSSLAFMWVLGIWSSSLHSKSQLCNQSSLAPKWKSLFA